MCIVEKAYAAGRWKLLEAKERELFRLLTSFDCINVKNTPWWNRRVVRNDRG
jgi:hypothetical protein